MPGCSAGATATVVIVDLVSRELACCNAGDSSALMVDRTKTSWVSVDHRLQENKAEQERLRDQGARIAYAMNPATKLPAGPMRLWPGGLAVSRSIGDSDCDLMIAEPDCNVVRIPESGAILVLASDGVWDAVETNELEKICRRPQGAHEAAIDFVDAAIRARGLRDDTTCIVLNLGAPFADDVSSSFRFERRGSGTKTAMLPNWLRGCVLPPPRAQPRLRFSQWWPSRSSVAEVSPGSALDMTVKGGFAFEVLFRGSRAAMRSPSGTRPPVADADETAWAGSRRLSSPAAKGSSTPSPRSRFGSGAGVGAGQLPAQTNEEALKPIPPGRKIHWDEINAGGISDVKFIGAGEFCSVYSAHLDDGKIQVAIKMLKDNKIDSPTAARDLEFEMHLMSRMDHRNILKCIGTSEFGQTPHRQFIALEMIRVTLHDALPPSPLPDGSSTLARSSAVKRWPMLRALHRSLELALAMRYCHDEAFLTYQLLHRDIKPKNIGLMDDGRLVVFDFGIARLMPCTQRHLEEGSAMTGICGSLRYMAPEVALSKKYNHKSEVYSFAIVMWEMLALRRPYEGVTQETFARLVCGPDGRRPPLDKKWPDELRKLLTRCWDPEFAKRPDFAEVVDVMMTLVATTEQERARPTSRRSSFTV